MPSARRGGALLLALVILGACDRARAQSSEALQPWDLLHENIGRIYEWPNTMFHISAVAVTPPLVLWVDAPVQQYFQDHDPLSSPFGDAAVIIGGVVPAAVPLAIYAGGLLGADAEHTTAGAAALQTLVVQFVVVKTLKWLTGRAGPYPSVEPDPRRSEARDEGRHLVFRPFDLWGGFWPSGHTASNVAFVSCLVAFYPDEIWLPFVGYLFASAIAFGMIEDDEHWFSDIVAGALIGHVIGWQIGKSFREHFEARKRHAAVREGASLEFSAEPLGLRLSGIF